MGSRSSNHHAELHGKDETLYEYDLLIANGIWFDGSAASARTADIAVTGGRVVKISPVPLDVSSAREVIDATGKWVMPGFVDVHTHYDVEMLVRPQLSESVRHGVTTAVVGNCSLTTILASDDDCADIFSRVEAVPRAVVMDALRSHRDWSGPAEYVKAIGHLKLGPNIAAFLGQSDLRVHVMGMDRAVDKKAKPSQAEIDAMVAILTEALDAGFLGLSATTNWIDKLDGDRYHSRALPSTFVKGREFRALNNVLRRRGRILQSTPRISLNPNVAKFFLAAGSRFRRGRLKVSLLAAADSKAYPPLIYFMMYGAPFLNRLLKGDFQWQHLPVPFTVYADGIDLVVFEEFGAGSAALDIKDQLERTELLKSEQYRRWFRRDYENKFSPKIWHRNLYDATVVECPDASLIGKNFGHIGDELGLHPVDAFLDLVVQYGRQIRWRTTIANHRPKYLDKLAANRSVHMGFGDAGAHLRNMAFYNYHLRLLERVKAAQGQRKPFLTIEQAVHRLTGELADWYNLDAGHLRTGDRADIAIIDPDGLDQSVHEFSEEEIPEYGGLRRMVNRNDNAVVATIIDGRVVYRNGVFADGFGTTWGTGRFLAAGQGSGSTDEPPAYVPHTTTRPGSAVQPAG
ncbi:D-amino acid aminohydrolase [Mycolicibacterium farcinogenes]|uniref:D-amino acid aminohydrolase n=1 Tax=Mycolicibacterium senegalense TaxID=1796 RepID=A0A378WAG2_9MYCO|nr:N-acyl-D-glutamate deacylase [Mycolicibacterium senegalense]CDP88116.1 D-amino acid aminohydrolase [Mycolicibacterium farcinogenes]SUA29554.1 D-amino acid aminohydrolase [Mycolicibacterium senegalense]